MDFRKESRGTGATKGVDLVISFYDNAKATKDGKVSAYYVEAWGHPDSALAKDQTNLALVSQRTEHNGKKVINHSFPLYPKQMEALIAAAGANVSPLLDRDGVRIGTNYGVKADLMNATNKEQAIGYIPNTKTLQPSDLSVSDINGKDIRSRIFASMKKSREVRDALKAQETPAVEKAVEAPAVEQVLEAEAELV